MRYVILSDVHGNLEALQAVIDEIKRLRYEKLVFLGDIVGYGANPNEVIEIIRSLVDRPLTLAGNHDYAAIGLTDISYFNSSAMEAILWTGECLTEKNIGYLRGLKVDLTYEGLTFAHSSPKEPDKWHYIMDISDAIENFDFFDTRICFVGHSHIPIIIEKDSTGDINIYNGEKRLNSECRYIINIGSVGQPRDRDPRSSFAVYDSETETIEIKRVSYDIAEAQEKILEKGLPFQLAYRLAYGR
ncbi:MAG: metallophosphoesterase family protein [Nitrospinae bacterium]|nr:metallophosphoesterase family protein [Nitrospinota bacterium]